MKRFLVRNIVEQAAVRDVQEACVYDGSIPLFLSNNRVNQFFTIPLWLVLDAANSLYLIEILCMCYTSFEYLHYSSYYSFDFAECRLCSHLCRTCVLCHIY